MEKINKNMITGRVVLISLVIVVNSLFVSALPDDLGVVIDFDYPINYTRLYVNTSDFWSTSDGALDNVADLYPFLVPYTGATANVDLGSYNLTTTGWLKSANGYFSGNVGIGTTSPLTNTHISANEVYSQSQSGQLYVGGTDTNKRLMIGYDTTNNFAFLEGINFGTSYSPIILNPFSGNVGIGTTSPGEKLEVNGGDVFVNNANAKLSLYSSSYSLQAVGGYLAHDGAQGNIFKSGGSEKVRIDVNGNVGIGTTNVYNKLTVGETESAMDGVIAVKTDSSGNAIAIQESSGTEYYGLGVNAGGDLQFTNSGGSNVVMTINDLGNVGIGTTSPANPLTVISDSSIYATSYIENENANGLGLLTKADGLYIADFRNTDNTYVMRIGGNGNVGIGTAGPTEKLSVYQLMDFQYGGGKRVTVGYNASTGKGEYYGLDTLGGLGFGFESNKNLLFLNNTGNVGIGTTTPQNLLNVLGDFNQSGTADNSFFNGIYSGAEYFNETGMTFTFGTQDLFYNFTGATCGLESGITCDDTGNTTFTISYDGVYTIHYEATGDGVNDHTYITAIAVNGVIQNSTRDIMIVASSGSETHKMVDESELRLNAGDKINLMIKDSSGTGDGTIYEYGINIMRVGN